MQHRGQIVETIVRKSGYKFTDLAKNLRITRNTLYNRFNNPDLSYSFISEVGAIIHHDFTVDFPDMKGMLAEDFKLQSIDREIAQLWKAETNYINLLEQYNKMLNVLAKLANQNKLDGIRKKIVHFIDQEQENPLF